MLRWKQTDDLLTIYLRGEIDHCTAEKMKAEMENLMKRTKDKPVILDFSEVTFMDSSGVGMLIGRYKTKTAYGGTIYASGLDAAIERLYRMAGLHRIMPILEEKREARA